MNPNRSFSRGLPRRALLSALAILPTLAGPFRATSATAQGQADPLPSWNDGAAKSAIVQFVARVTTQGGPDFVPPDRRIATFDNDGTLWIEQPVYVQLAFVLDRVKALAPQNPSWKSKQPFKAVLDGDMRALVAAGEKALVELIATTHAGMTVEEFDKIVTDWVATARDPRFQKPYTELVYQPILEVMTYLRANGFKTFIVSGGGIEFMRPWTEGLWHSAGASRGLLDQDPVRNARRPAQAVPSAADQFHRRQDRKTCRYQPAHWPTAHRCVRQFGRRFRNAAMDYDEWQRCAAWSDRSSYRRRTRICLRPQVALRKARPSARRRGGEQVDCGQHENRLEAHFPIWIDTHGHWNVRPDISRVWR
jgi:phosphoserine phosphatase